MKTSQLDRKRVFRLFAEGSDPEQVVEEFEGLNQSRKTPRMTLARAEILFEEYLSLEIGEKLRLTLMPECVSNRLHRLMDDVSDLKRVDRLIAEADKASIVPLLDIKRKIKERMTKECTTGSESCEDETDDEIQKFYDENCTSASNKGDVLQ